MHMPLLQSMLFVGLAVNCQVVDADLTNADLPADASSARATWLASTGDTQPDYTVDFESGFMHMQDVSGDSAIFPGGLIITDTSPIGMTLIGEGPSIVDGSNPVGAFALVHSQRPSLVLTSSEPTHYLGFVDIDHDGLSIEVEFAGGLTESFTVDATADSGDSGEFVGIVSDADSDRRRIVEVRITPVEVGLPDELWGIDNIEYGRTPSSHVVAGIGGTHLTIQDAVDASYDDPESLVTVMPGVYTGVIEIDTKALTLRASSLDPAETTIDAPSFSWSRAAGAVEGLTIGDSPGAGILVLDTDLIIRRCVFRGVSAAITTSASTLDVVDCLFEACGYAAWFQEGSVACVDRCIVRDLTTPGISGLHFLESGGTVSNTLIHDSFGAFSGLILANQSSSVDVINCTVADNANDDETCAAGIVAFWDSNVTIANSILHGNTAWAHHTRPDSSRQRSAEPS